VHIIYLHGFCSSTQSFKAKLVEQYVKNHPEHSIYLIDLPHFPAQAMALIEAHIAGLDGQQWGVVGSSLGGYYATYLAEKYRVKSVLINPAVDAHILLEPLLGENKNYHSQQTFELTPEHLSQLQALAVANLSKPMDALLLTQTGDEVLDYKKGVDYYVGAKQVVIEGGTHGFDDYADYLDCTFEHLKG